LSNETKVEDCSIMFGICFLNETKHKSKLAVQLDFWKLITLAIL